MTRIALILAGALVAAGCNGEAVPAAPPQVAVPAECAPRADGSPSPHVNRGLATAPLEIATAGGAVHRFTVEIARTGADQQRGLMCRTALGGDEGMIFPFAHPQPASFWMRNTLISLDIIFVRVDGTIAGIGEGVPLSLDNVTSGGEPVAAVLELAGGRAEALGIRPGDRVTWRDPAAR